MKISRETSLTINNFLDQFIPPFIRDSKLFMYIPLKLLFKDKTKIYMNFKYKAFSMSDREFADVYDETSSTLVHGETDLNKSCTKKIVRSIVGPKVLEVGCGRGYLANLLSKRYKVFASDIVIEDNLTKKYPGIKFIKADIHKLPFRDAEFDTVVCTHTLEHVLDLQRAIQELRRVTKRRLIIVVPKQRPYEYNFNLHLHFFPYRWSLESVLGHRKSSFIEDLGDWFYYEDK